MSFKEKRQARQKEKESYKQLYKETYTKRKAELDAQRKQARHNAKVNQLIAKAERKAKGLQLPKLKVDKKKVTKTTLKLLKTGAKTLDTLYGGGRGGIKVSRSKPKRKSPKRKSPKRKSYYCRKCHKRHSYTSKIGRKHK